MTTVETTNPYASYRGRSLGVPHLGPDPVNVPMVRHWCEAIDDRNPVYLDAHAAASSVHGGLVAPPTMLQAWIMFGLRPPLRASTPQDELFVELNQAGFTSVVATNCNQTYHRYLRPGDHVSLESKISDVSDMKTTGLGDGHFISSEMLYRVGDELVATMIWRLLKFRPRGKAGGAPPQPGQNVIPDITGIELPSWPAPAPAKVSPFVDDIAAGDELPELVLPLDRTIIMATAIASRDYQEVHHDPGLAVLRGSQDIFMNILSTNGFCGRFVTDWAGPDAVLNNVSIRLGVPNYAGDVMTMTGSVTDADPGSGEVTVTLQGANSLGNHVTGTVTLTLPRRAAA